MQFVMISFLVAVVFVSIQKYLSGKQNWLLGAIVPIVSVALMAGIIFYKDFALNYKTILPCVLIVAIEILIWIDQRRKHTRSELNKMKAKDI